MQRMKLMSQAKSSIVKANVYRKFVCVQFDAVRDQVKRGEVLIVIFN